MSNRIEKVNSLIQTELSQIFLKEVDFPKNILATITRVETVPNLSETKNNKNWGWTLMAEEEQKTGEQPRTGNDNNVFIGGKPFMNYVTAVVMQFTTKNAPEVIVKARGKFISRAVDVAEVSAKRFLENQIAVKDIKIDSEGFKNKEGRDVRVSTIEISLLRK